jgi:cobalamin biosynthesis protein CobT
MENKYSIDTLRSVARGLSDTYDVEIIFAGTVPKTDGKIIYLPSYDDIRENEWLAIRGYIDHEVGHIKYSFDREASSLLRDYMRKYGKLFTSLANIVEDFRIERLMSNNYLGSFVNFERVTNDIVEEMIKKGEINILSGLDLYIRLFYSGYKLIVFEENEAFLNKIKNEIEDFFGVELLNKVPTVVSEIDAIELALEFYKILQEKLEEQDKEEQQNEEDYNNREDTEEGCNCEEGDNEESSEEEGGDGGEEESNEDCEKGGKGGGEGSNEEEDKESEDGNFNRQEDSKDTEKEECESLYEEVQPEKVILDVYGQDDASNLNVTKNKSIAEEVYNGLIVEFAEGVFNKIREYLESGGKDSYTVATKDFDLLLKVPQQKSLSQYKRIKQSIPVSNSERQKLVNFFISQKLSRWEYEKESGRVDNRRLSSLSVGNKFIFKTKQPSRKINTAVTLLVDCSGSMAGYKLECAIAGAIAMSEIFNSAGVNFEILGFTDFYTDSYFGLLQNNDIIEANPQIKFEALRKKFMDFLYTKNFLNCREFSRQSHLLLWEFKSFKDMYNAKVQKRLAYAANSKFSQYCYCNVDGESIEYAHSRLLKQSAQRKFLFVLSDGVPVVSAGDSEKTVIHTKKVIESIEQAGKVDIFGIGYESKNVMNFYKNYTIIRDVSQFPKQLLELMEKTL